MRKRILIVEDEAAILNALALYFGNQGYEVDMALERTDAESLLAGRCYDAVLADLRLGGSSDTGGLDLVSLARERCPGIRIVLLTAYGSAEIEQEAWSRGIDAFLHKPQPLSAIATVVASLLQHGG